MKAKHSFFVPQETYCIDEVGLVSALHLMVVKKTCYTCYIEFSSTSALQQHLVRRIHFVHRN